LVCKRYERRSGDDYPWQSFHLSRVIADAAFADVKTMLDAYQIKDDDGPLQVETPSGDDFSCYQYYYD